MGSISEFVHRTIEVSVAAPFQSFVQDIGDERSYIIVREIRPSSEIEAERACGLAQPSAARDPPKRLQIDDSISETARHGDPRSHPPSHGSRRRQEALGSQCRDRNEPEQMTEGIGNLDK
jgi:hypothetical protein